jgi:hypothetical protein
MGNLLSTNSSEGLIDATRESLAGRVGHPWDCFKCMEIKRDDMNSGRGCQEIGAVYRHLDREGMEETGVRVF